MAGTSPIPNFLFMLLSQNINTDTGCLLHIGMGGSGFHGLSHGKCEGFEINPNGVFMGSLPTTFDL